jgi:hypothetical protein
LIGRSWRIDLIAAFVAATLIEGATYTWKAGHTHPDPRRFLIAWVVGFAAFSLILFWVRQADRRGL